jgi:membrane-bound inhibitor of C-type lysozyme
MAIPDNNGNGTSADWSLQTVDDEIKPAVSSLTNCFAAATASKFDPNYEGSKNQLLNFRNYDGNFMFRMSQGYNTQQQACASTDMPNQVYFLNNSITGSSRVYQDSALSVWFPGNEKFYKVYYTGFNVVIQIGNTGYVMDPPTIC